MNLSWYAERGYYLIPIVPEQKSPAIKAGSGFARSTSELGALEQWEQRFPAHNWGMCLANSGLVAVDVDRAGLEEWKRLTDEHGVPDTLTQKSGSGIGRHFVFKHDPNVRYKGKIATGIDIKYNGFIVVQPSVHNSGGRYVWDNPEREPQEMPEWLRELCISGAKSDKIREAPVPIDPNVDKDRWAELQSLVKYLKDKEFGYEEWVKIGMGLHAETNGSEEGLGLYLELTRGINCVDGDEDQAIGKWSGFKPAGGIGIGTIAKLARERGYAGADLDFESAPEEVGNEEPQKSGWEAVGDKLVARTKMDAIRLINEMDWFISKKDGGWTGIGNVKTNTLIWFRDNGRKNMLGRYWYRTMAKKKGSEEMEVVYVPAEPAWLKSSKATTYERVDFDLADAGPDVLNFGEGIKDSLKNADDVCGEYLERALVMINNLCGRDEKKTKAFLSWLAHIIQYPHIRTSIIPVFITTQGAGKNLLSEIIKHILKSTFLLIESEEDLMGSFNAHQGRKLLTVVNELNAGKNKAVLSRIKALSGSDTITLNEKNSPKIEINNYSRYMLFSNDNAPVIIEPGNRRLMLFSCLEKLSAEFYSSVGYDHAAKTDNKPNVAKALHYYLLNYDLTGYNPKEFSEEMGEGGDEAKESTMTAAGRFFRYITTQEAMKLWKFGASGQHLLDRKEAYRLFQKWHGNAKYTPHSFWAEFKRDVGKWPVSRGNDNGYYFMVSPKELSDAMVKLHRLSPPEMEFKDEDYVIDYVKPDFTPDEF